MTRTGLLARCLVAAGVATTLAAWALIGPFFMPGPDTWWAELLRFAPWPLLMLPGLVALGAAASLGWAWRVAALLALALVAFDTMDLRIGQPDAGSRGLRLMSWNAKAFVATRSATGDAAIAAEIRRHAPDVLLLQDVTGYARAGTPLPWPLLQALQGYHVVRRWQYLVAARWPLQDCTLLPLGPAGPDDDAALRCTLRHDAGDIDLVNVHFASPRRGLTPLLRLPPPPGALAAWRANAAARSHQARQLAAALGPARGPRIVAGDLNAIDASPVTRTLRATGLRDAFASAGRGYGFTLGDELVGFGLLRIDHVLVDASIGVRQVETGDTDAFEHRPLIADLWLRRH